MHVALLVQLAGYKIKCMLAEPKGKRGRTEIAWSSEPQSPAHQVGFSASEHLMAWGWSAGIDLHAQRCTICHCSARGEACMHTPTQARMTTMCCIQFVSMFAFSAEPWT